MTIEQLVDAITKLGFPVALVLYFIYRDFTRAKEDRKDKQALSQRIKEVEDYQKDKLEKITIESSATMKAVSLSTDRLIESTDKTHAALLRRPCIAGDLRGDRA